MRPPFYGAPLACSRPPCGRSTLDPAYSPARVLKAWWPMNRFEGIPDSVRRFERFSRELQDESDRGCAILIMCLLEESLRDLIKALLPSENAKIDRLAPKGALGIAIENAVLLGLLSERQGASFNALVKVRNKFAHGLLEGLSFDSPEIASVISSVPKAIPWPKGEKLSNDTNRGRYLMEAGILFTLMTLKAYATTRLPAAVDFDASQGIPGFPPPPC